MTLYIVTAVRLAKHDEVDRVKWAEADGSKNEFVTPPYDVTVDQVVAALDRLDRVEMRFTTSNGSVSGGALVRKTLPGGFETVTEEHGKEGRMLRDLPKF